jgi:hypothetical protein
LVKQAGVIADCDQNFAARQPNGCGVGQFAPIDARSIAPRGDRRCVTNHPRLFHGSWMGTMSIPLNEHCFREPHWRVIAGGFQTEAWFNDGQAVGTGGILNPQPTHLRTGQFYYRFASSTSAREARSGGGWWLDFENFRAIRAFADEQGYSIREAARLMLALPYSWTRVDLLIRALLKEPLKAYTGEGKPAQGREAGADKDSLWIPTQHIKVRQLYIPGLYVKGSRPRQQLFERAFSWPAEVVSL